MFRYSLRILLRNKLMTAFVSMILTICFMLIAICTSSVLSKIEDFLPLKECLSHEGVCIYAIGIDVGVNGIVYNTINDVKSISPDCIDEVYGCSELELYDDNGKAYAYSYTDNLISLYKPEMLAGKWLDDVSDDDEYIPIVCAYSDKYAVGDTLYLDNNGVAIKAKVCGILAENASVISTDSTTDITKEIDFRDMYKKPEYGYLYTRCTDVEKLNITQNITGRIFVTYKNNLTKNQQLELHRQLYSFGTIFGLRDEIYVHSLNYLRSDIILILPITICIIILSIIGSCAVCTISTKTNLKLYKIFYNCGANTSVKIIIPFLVAVWQTIIALIVGFFIIIILGRINLKYTIIVNISAYEVILCLAMAIITIIINLVASLIITKNE